MCLRAENLCPRLSHSSSISKSWAQIQMCKRSGRAGAHAPQNLKLESEMYETHDDPKLASEFVRAGVRGLAPPRTPGKGQVS